MKSLRTPGVNESLGQFSKQLHVDLIESRGKKWVAPLMDRTRKQPVDSAKRA